jgi:hypothetical protein
MTDIPDVLNSIVEWLNIIIGIFLLTFGIIGNCLNIYVFTRPAYRNRTTVLYFLACSVASCIQLLNTLLPRILSDGFQISIVKSNNFYCQIRNLISAVASLCAISYPCWASFDQFLSTSRNPITRQHWSSKRFISWVIFSTALFWFIIFLPNTIFTRSSSNTCITNNLQFHLLYYRSSYLRILILVLSKIYEMHQRLRYRIRINVWQDKF